MKFCRNIQKLSLLSFILISCPALYLNSQPARLIVFDPLIENEYRNSVITETARKVIILPNEGNPIKFITNELMNYTYDEVHLFMLTKPGSIVFDEINIISENIEDYSGDFSEWKNILNPGSEIIIHSENLTSEPEGLFLVKKITEFTGRAVVVKK